MKGTPMKKFKKTVMIVDNIMIDDHLKVAGLLYRVHQIEKIGESYIIHFYNVRRPRIEGMLTLETNTLIHIWNQK
jgi:hypothetical protein